MMQFQADSKFIYIHVIPMRFADDKPINFKWISHNYSGFDMQQKTLYLLSGRLLLILNRDSFILRTFISYRIIFFSKKKSTGDC